MRVTHLKVIAKYLINFLIQATQNPSQLKYLIFNYLYGVIFGTLLWTYVILELCFGVEPFWILCFVVIGFGTGSCLFGGVRCVITLIWLEFLGKTGINVLKAIVLIALISGPIENLSLNAKEVVRVFQCSSELMFNLTLSKITLMSKPFTNAIRETSSNLTQIQDSLDMIQGVLSPISNEIETPFNSTKTENFSNESRFVRVVDPSQEQDQAKYIRQNYVTKINERCKLQLETAVKKCEKSFADAYDRCYDKLPAVVNTLLCWPMKMDTMCTIFKSSDTDKVCDASNVIDRDFGDAYVELKTLEKSLLKHNDDKVNISTDISMNPSAELKTMKEINNKFNKEINHKSKIFAGCIFIIRKILSLVFLHTISGAYGYYKRYLSQIEFDNRFITKYFEKIDLRRMKNRQMYLLPLKAIEKKSIIVSKFNKLKLNELWFMVPFLIKLLFEIMFASCFVMFNHLLYVSLVAIAKHGEIIYHQEAELIIETAVNGTGVVALLVKQFLHNFNINENVSAVYSNIQCLPKPKKLSAWFIVKIYGIYFVTFLYKLNLTYVQRMRTNVMAIYYPKREKKRILHLYNKCLKKRKRMHESTKKKLLKKLRNCEDVDTNLFRILIQKCAPHLNWLRILPCVRRKCFICNAIESFGLENVLLSSDEFAGFYCNECWQEFAAVFDEIRLRRYSGSESGTSHETDDTDSTD